jgi:hypothetical protein
VLSLPPSVRVFVATQPVDGRKGPDSLMVMVRDVFRLDIFSGHLFVFFSKRRNQTTFNIPIDAIHGALPVAPVARTPRSHRASRR